jgi:hypothetical protein
MTYLKKPVKSGVSSSNKVWTKEDLGILESLASRGASSIEIANILGRTRASILCRKSTMGLKGRLSSSKGKGIAPTIIKSKIKVDGEKLKNETYIIKIQKDENKIGLSKTNQLSDIPMYANSIQGLRDLKKLAKLTGAKIVITLE